jgi:CHAT domain-containing protein/tetratricopeptide (TPR) repeat protein
MPVPPLAEHEITAFFRALRERNTDWLDQCHRAITVVQQQERLLPEVAGWADYLLGILAFEAEHHWSKAEHCFARLLSEHPDPVLHSRALFALGRCYDIQGRWQQAIDAFAQLEQIGNGLDYVKGWKHIAITICRAYSQGAASIKQLQQAANYCNKALDVLIAIDKPGTEVRWLTGSTWNELGAVNMNLGNLDLALDCYRHGLQFNQSLKDRSGVGIGYLNIGEIYHQQGPVTWPLALDQYRKALRSFRDSHSPDLEADVLSNMALLFQEMQQPQRALRYYRKAIELLEQLRIQDTTVQGRAGFFGTVVDTITHAALLCWDTGRVIQAFEYAERARARAFLDTLAIQSSVLLPNIEHHIITLRELQAALPQDAILLAFFTTGLIDPSIEESSVPMRPDRYRFPKSRILLFLVTKHSIATHEATIEPNLLQPRMQRHVVEQNFRQAPLCRALYQALIAPIAHMVSNYHRIYLVPHGPLHYVPFALLTAADGETFLRAHGPQLIYGFSATFLFQRTKTDTVWQLNQCLALGYNGTSAVALSHAEREARRVVELCQGLAITGAAVTKAEVLRYIGHYRIVHIACHGDFNPFSPLDSALYLAPDEKLTAEEIIDSLRIQCDLVVLSACESGLSAVQRGDELLGLPRAFVYAGARAIIATQWRVDDQVTYHLMEQFYQALLQGHDSASALTMAQFHIRTYYETNDWAAFILIGNPTSVLFIAEGSVFRSSGE